MSCVCFSGRCGDELTSFCTQTTGSATTTTTCRRARPRTSTSSRAAATGTWRTWRSTARRTRWCPFVSRASNERNGRRWCQRSNRTIRRTSTRHSTDRSVASSEANSSNRSCASSCVRHESEYHPSIRINMTNAMHAERTMVIRNMNGHGERASRATTSCLGGKSDDRCLLLLLVVPSPASD